MTSKMTPVITNNTGEYYILSKTKTGNFSNNIIQCNTNNCYIIYDTCYYGCEKTSVYASNSQSLEITCTASQACKYMELLSEPSFELTVNCVGISSCAMFSILSQNKLQGETTVNCLNQWACSSMNLACSDNGNCNINCQKATACDYARIISKNAGVVNLNCYENSCSKTSIHAEYADEVHITCHGVKSCYNADFFVNNSKKVTFTARGDVGYSTAFSARTAFYASNANSVMITCTTGYKWHHACVAMNWYIPNNAIINCYGNGCGYDYALYGNAMYVENASDIQMNINGCGVCNSINECIESYWSINCFNGIDYDYFVEKLDTNCEYQYGDYSCGCNSLVQNRKWFNKPSDPLCYAPCDDCGDIQDSEDSGSDVVVIIIIIVIVIVLVIIIIGLVYYKKNYVSAVSVNDPNETAENSSINEENNNIAPSAPTPPPGYNVNGTFEDGKMGENDRLIEGNEGHRINFDLNEWFRNDVELNEYNTMYIALFVENGFDNIKALKEMTDEDLSSIGINKLGHRKVILSAIRNIQ